MAFFDIGLTKVGDEELLRRGQTYTFHFTSLGLPATESQISERLSAFASLKNVRVKNSLIPGTTDVTFVWNSAAQVLSQAEGQVMAARMSHGLNGTFRFVGAETGAAKKNVGLIVALALLAGLAFTFVFAFGRGLGGSVV